MPRGKYNPLHVFIWSIVWVNAEIWCHAGCVSAQFPHLKPPSLPPGNYNFLSHSSQSNFVLFLRSHFTNSFVKLHKSISSPVKPSLGKQWQGNSPFQTKRRIKEQPSLIVGIELIVLGPAAATLQHNETQTFHSQNLGWNLQGNSQR